MLWSPVVCSPRYKILWYQIPLKEQVIELFRSAFSLSYTLQHLFQKLCYRIIHHSIYGMISLIIFSNNQCNRTTFNLCRNFLQFWINLLHKLSLMNLQYYFIVYCNGRTSCLIVIEKYQTALLSPGGIIIVLRKSANFNTQKNNFDQSQILLISSIQIVNVNIFALLSISNLNSKINCTTLCSRYLSAILQNYGDSLIKI